MRNKYDLDTLSMDDWYNNPKVYASEIKGQTSSSSNSQSVAFVSSDNSSSTNETINTAHSGSAASSKDQVSTTSYVDNVMFSFFPNQSNAPQLDDEDLEQIDADDLEEMDLKWQVAMLTTRVKRFIKKIGKKLDLNEKETVGFDKTKVECYNCHRRGHFARECRAPRNQWNINRDASRRNAPVDTSTTNALVVQDGIGGYDWSLQAKEGLTNFALMAFTSQGSSSSDSEREALNKSNLEIIGYQMGLESLEARIVVHEKNEADYEENIVFLKYDVHVKDISIKDLKNQLEEALKEKDDLKLKLEKFKESSKNLTKLINSQISAKDKTRLDYDSQINESELNNIHKNKSEVIHSVFNSRESDVDDNPVNDRFKTGEGFHAVHPLYIGNYIPPRPELSFAGLDESVFKSAVRKTTTSVPETETSISKTSKDIIEKLKTVRPSAPIIEEWDTNNDNDSVFKPKSNQTKPKFTKINIVKYEKPVLNNKGRVTGQREIRPVWNNAQRNHQNKLNHPHPKRNFVPTAVATKSGQVLVNADKQSSPRAATSISTARPVDTAALKPKVNNVTTAGPKAVVSAAKGNGENAVKFSPCWIWRPTGNVIDHISKDNGSYMHKRFDYVDLQGRLNGCSRHMTGNKSFLIDSQEIDSGFVAFGGSPKGGKITGKSVLFTKTEYFVLSLDFKLLDESQVLLKVPRQNNMYSFDLKNVVPSGGKFDGKVDEGFLVGYFINSKAFRVFNTRTRKVEENLHTTFLKNKPNVAGSGPNWLFDIDLLTNSMNYEPVSAGNQTNRNAGIKDNVDVIPTQKYILLPLLSDSLQSLEDVVTDDTGKKTTEEPANEDERNGQEKEGGASNKEVSTVSPSVSADGQSFINANDLPTDPLMPDLEDTTDLLNTGIFSGAYDDEDVGAEADLNTWKQP
ncbi:ribonuclease H-like domain-containing protein [Tanacetum coccineum]|uniref:Ribonuclease H-like domain-containing protein n=1 Tax=Tanacetum coccineum TaxID=301880 RepID=A0ABQ4WQV8_9ASTR